jgi:HSP20 family molecular chaperone IbpA
MSPKFNRAGAHAIGLALMLIPILTLAWTPYGSGPNQGYPNGPDQGAPMDPGGTPFGYDRSFGRDFGPDFDEGFFPDFDRFFGQPFSGRSREGRDRTPPYGPPMSGPESYQGGFGRGGPMGRSGGLRIDRRATDDAYLLDIQLSGIKPTEVEVRVQGPWILISRTSSAQSDEKETMSDGRGYRQSFSYSSGSMSRRFNLPQDADGTALQRQDADDAIHISIPRTKLADPR